MIVGYEDITEAEARDLLRMLMNHARQVAGTFHGRNRSAKFRANWPDENVFAHSEWRYFVQTTLNCYAEALGDPHCSDTAKRRMYLATMLWHMAAANASEQFMGEQILPDSQKFEGERHENDRIAEMFGRHAMSFADLALPGKRFH